MAKIIIMIESLSIITCVKNNNNNNINSTVVIRSKQCGITYVIIQTSVTPEIIGN